ncbi:AmmeMemoRadiSam system protein A [uncultured Vibrio sp.]|uniref:AmmeMemoRadiSam system protein A n=1 Tax=uncultured Vibrio sp. TaxID=114054 RepID=UPI0029C8284C|nr:AmmeMemoRadiSam system protein A [uncultured Vibrio sp.]
MPASSCFELSQEAKTRLLQMVWQVLDEAIRGNGLQLPPEPDDKALLEPAASFVTLQHHGKLRGCIGSLKANEPLWLNVCKNAYSSGFQDSRFLPLTTADRAGLNVDISVLSDLKPLKNHGEANLLATLRPGIDGLLLEDEGHRAVFLPSVWEVLPTPEQFVRALKRKGGWSETYWNEGIVIHHFTTDVISEI